jgi:hypothetical protein
MLAAGPLAIAAVADCAASSAHGHAPANQAAPEDAAMVGVVIPVQVQNDNMQDVNIFVLHGGMRTRIGVAGAAQATAFTFPAHYSAGATMVQLAAVPLIGGRFGWRKSVLSEPVVVHGGERLVFTLESDLSRSTIAVYPLQPAVSPDSTLRADTSRASESSFLAFAALRHRVRR